MNNHLLGFVISGLLHAGMIGVATNIEIKQKPEPVVSNKTMLMVSMFKEKETVPVAKVTPENVKKPVVKGPVTVSKKVIEKPVAPTLKTKPAVILKPAIPSPAATTTTSNSQTKPIIVKTKPIVKPKPKTKEKKPLPKKKAKKITKKKIIKKLTQKARPKRIIKPTVKKQAKRVVKKNQQQVKKTRPKVIISRTKKPIRKVVNTRNKSHPVQARSSQRSLGVQRSQTRLKMHNTRKQSTRPRTQITAKKAVPNRSQSINLVRQYKARLQQLIASNKRYPKRAKRRNQQGKVTLGFNVTHSGNISNIKVLKSSNNPTLNGSAIQTVKNSSGKLPYPPKMSKKLLSLRITLNYLLK